MASQADGAATTVARARPGPGSVPVTRPRGALAFLLPFPVAAAAGLGVGLAPHAALVGGAALLSALLLMVRVEWAALAVICTAVFTDYLDPVWPWATDWLAAVLVVAWLVRRAQGPLHQHRLRAAVVPAVALTGAVLVAFVTHPHGWPGLTAGARYVELVVVMLVLADCLCGPLSPRLAARAYVLSCVLAAACGLVTAIVSDRHRVDGPLASADALAFFLVAALPLVGTVRSRRSRSDWPAWACFAVLLAAGVGTQSRPAFVALVAMLLIAVLTGQLALRYAGALLAAVTTAVALLLAAVPLPIGQALTDPQRYSDTTMTQRIHLREAALDMTTASPVVGLGPAGFALFHESHHGSDAATNPGGGDVDTAYSTVLEASAELGALGLVTLYAVWLVPLATARRRMSRGRSGLTGPVQLALAGLLTASLLESAQYALPLWFLTAMTLALGRPAPPRTPLFPVRSDARTSGQVGPRS